MIRNVILVLLMLTVIASVHEAGHMLTAQAFGAGVIEYAVGIGPALIKRRIGGTLYSLRVLPLGGFCRLKDIDEKDCDKTKGRCLRDLPHWQQALVMLAGPLSNLALALVVCTLSVLIYGYYPPEISSVPEGGAAYGILQEGDLITSIDGHRTRMLEDASELIASSEDGTVTVGFERDGRPMTAAIRMKETEEGRKLGIVFALDRKRCSPAGILPCGLERARYQTWTIVKALRDAVLGSKKLQLAGVVGVASEVGSVMDSASPGQGLDIMELFLTVVSILSINIGLINALPLPVLDGGRTAFIIAEGLTGRDLKAQQDAANGIGMLVIIAIFAYAFYSDFINYIWR